MAKNYKIFVLSFLVFAALFMHYSAANKYSSKSNKKAEEYAQLENEDAPFRMKKINLLWTKAKKFVSGQKLAELYADLRMQDRDEGNLKKLKSTNSDPSGKKEAEVLESFKYIIEYYGLDDYTRQNFDNEIPMGNDEVKSVNFQDSKLQSMWRRAEKSGFDDKDLQILKEEFWHQQMKLNEFAFLRRQLNTGADHNDDIMVSEEHKVNLSPEEHKEKMSNLKKHNKDIKDGYVRLQQMASEMPKKELEFEDYRVQKLWALAQKTNWTESQMAGFKEELKHFEHRLSKQDYYQEQLELTRDALKDQVKESNEYPEKLTELKEKTDLVKEKVKKLHTHMKTRLEKALLHSEL